MADLHSLPDQRAGALQVDLDPGAQVDPARTPVAADGPVARAGPTGCRRAGHAGRRRRRRAPAVPGRERWRRCGAIHRDRRRPCPPLRLKSTGVTHEPVHRSDTTQRQPAGVARASLSGRAGRRRRRARPGVASLVLADRCAPKRSEHRMLLVDVSAAVMLLRRVLPRLGVLGGHTDRGLTFRAALRRGPAGGEEQRKRPDATRSVYARRSRGREQ
jgi:hypothetical protein